MSTLPSWMDDAVEVNREQAPAGASMTEELLRFETELSLPLHDYYEMFLAAVSA